MSRWQVWLFRLALIGLFIPIPRLGLPLSPENLIYAGFLALWAMEPRAIRPRVPPVVRNVALATLGFMLLQCFVKFFFLDESLWEPTLFRRALLLVMACHTMRSMRDIQIAAACIVGGMLVSGVIGILTVFDFGPAVALFNRFAEFSNAELDRAEEIAELAGNRLLGLRGSVFGFSYLTAPAFLLLCGFLSRALQRRSVRDLVICYGCMGVVLLCMALNAERSSFLALAAGLAVLIFAQRSKELVAFIVTPLVVGAMALISLNSILRIHQGRDQNNFVERMDRQDTGEYAARAGLAAAGVLTVLDHPLSGGSNDDYQRTAGSLEVIRRFHLNYGDLPPSHNSYVNAGTRAGVAGWFLLAWLLSACVGLMPRRRAGRSTPVETDAIALSLKAAFIACMVNAIFHNQGLVSSEPMTWSILALGAGSTALGMQFRSLPAMAAQPSAVPMAWGVARNQGWAG